METYTNLKISLVQLKLNSPASYSAGKLLISLVVFLQIAYLTFISGYFGYIPSISELRDMQTPNTSEVLTSDGLIIGKFFKENRKDISFSDLPQNLIDALISTEDKRYYTHSGIDLRALGRVAIYSLLLKDRRSGGGSTLSQQLSKNLFPRQSHKLFSTPLNKIREMIIAKRLERAYTKDNLLCFYLNTVPFGNVFGIETASQKFFNKSAKDLRIEESCVLVGMLQRNTGFNPYRNPKQSLARRNEVIDKMVESTKLDKLVGDRLKSEEIHLDYQPTLKDNMAAYFKDYLRIELPKMLDGITNLDGKPYDIYKDGLKIYTTIDSRLQILAEEAVNERMSALQAQFDEHCRKHEWLNRSTLLEAIRTSKSYLILRREGRSEEKIIKIFQTPTLLSIPVWQSNRLVEIERYISPLDSIKHCLRQLQTGFMVSDPRSGHIKAWVGGTDFNFVQYDHIRSKRQVGSTFKPILYAAAIQAGINPCDFIPNELTAYMSDGTTRNPSLVSQEDIKSNRAWIPHNSDEDYLGSYSLEGGLTYSVNTVSANLINRLKPKTIGSLANKLGIASPIENNLSIALGTSNISLYEMMRVYSTFANRGTSIKPICVLKITTRDGETIVDFTKRLDKPKQVLSTKEAGIMTHMMQSVIENGTGRRLKSYVPTSNIAGKTGTTQSQSDGWFLGYTPNLVFGAWVGASSPSIHFRDLELGQGSHTALPICGIFLKKLYNSPNLSRVLNEKFQEDKETQEILNCPLRRYPENDMRILDSLVILGEQLGEKKIN